ncbi:uncharacterized protein [Physcomitrium patens]|uniref:HMA domain-containing protein n=1 Tax=Physcomitrium patens TaxID=3218 RepID=A0A2K1IFL4_PHYPA|nr:titin-like [Physcomitrium patens]PNR28066.1 hypothetical protein PHYPA_028658 [Physcomitrium patens]|eukprot:XP_024363259.1 titin-like [Physcomitrella patens]
MLTLTSMEDLFYGPPEPTWILPTRDETPPRRYKEHEYYKVREVIEPQRRSYYPSPPRPAGRPVQHRPVIDRNIRPVVPAGPAPLTVDRDIRPVVRDERSHPVEQEIRPIERLARVHTVPEQVPIRAPQEEIRKVVEVPVPVPVPVHVPAPPEVVHVQHRDVAPPPQVVKRSISPPIPRPPVHHPIELKVPMCCEKCAKKVKDRLLDLEGVENVVTDQYNQKAIVYGHADPARVLQRVKKVKKRSAFWDMAVDYSEDYRRSCYEQAEYARAKAARAESSKAEYQTKALRAPNPSNASSVIVNLSQAHNGPVVTAILPAETKNAEPYIANTRTRSQRCVRLPKADRHEFYHEGSQPRHAQGEYYYVLRDQHEG